MAEIYQPLQIMRDGLPTGKWRMTWRSDESADGFIGGLCDHEHDSAEDAAQCEDARRAMPPEMADSFRRAEAAALPGACECAGWARSGQRFATQHHPNCQHYAPEADARELIEALLTGINNWACDCDGIPDEMWVDVQRARAAIGLWSATPGA